MNHEKGLTQKEAEEQLKKYGPNELREVSKVTSFDILIRQIKSNFIIYLLVFASILSFMVGKTITAYTIIAVIAMIIIVGFLQEYRAEKALKALKGMITHSSIAIRDGKERKILSSEIVPGDILVLRSGERIPADCIILEQKLLLVDESVLTGESKEVKKEAALSMKEYSDENTVFMGTHVVNGRAVCRVLHTGMNTSFGKIAEMISSTEKEMPLQNKVNKIAKYMAFIAVAVSLMTGFVMVYRVDAITQPFVVEVMILIIALSVSAFPEGFPVVLITTLSTGVYKMAKKNAIVNRMSIIETLGETTVICSDKTGTITKGQMTVKKIFADNQIIEVTGVGYESKGEFTLKNSKIDSSKNETLDLLLKTSVFCNDTHIEKALDGKTYDIIGTPTEAALLIMAAKGNHFIEDYSFTRIEEIPFNSDRKMMTVLGEEKGRTCVFSKGAPEILLDKCSHILVKGKKIKLTEKEKLKILEANNTMSNSAMRTLALAYKIPDSKKTTNLENNLTFLGLTGMEDPPREGVKEAIKTCLRAGIKVKMITGDNKDTAIAIAKQINLNGNVIEGYELDSITDEELASRINEISIFARVRPEHKLRIVKVLKKKGEIVSMTGDGVNDAPALKEAHIGIAMGITGTDVSREVSDLILKDDNFITIVDAIRQGRTIFNNIRKFVTYQLSCNYAELSILFAGVLLAPFFGWPVPILLALQILFMNLVTDNLPAITLGLNNPSDDIMNEKPRKNAEILSKNFIILLIFSGTIMALISLLVFWFTFNYMGQSAENARTTTLLALISLEIASAFNFRSFRKGVLNRSPFVNPYLIGASVVSILATIAIIYTPLNKAFGTVPLPLIDWAIAIAFAIVIIALFDILKKINNKRESRMLELK